MYKKVGQSEVETSNKDLGCDCKAGGDGSGLSSHDLLHHVFFPFLVCGTDFADLMNAYFKVIAYTDLSSFWFFLFNYHYKPVADGLHQFTLHAYGACLSLFRL